MFVMIPFDFLAVDERIHRKFGSLANFIVRNFEFISSFSYGFFFYFLMMDILKYIK